MGLAKRLSAAQATLLITHSVPGNSTAHIIDRSNSPPPHTPTQPRKKQAGVQAMDFTHEGTRKPCAGEAGERLERAKRN